MVGWHNVKHEPNTELKEHRLTDSIIPRREWRMIFDHKKVGITKQNIYQVNLNVPYKFQMLPIRWKNKQDKTICFKSLHDLIFLEHAICNVRFSASA